MTREEMKVKSKSATNRIAVYVLVDEIYDDFESRTCENCSHFVPIGWTDFENKCMSPENKVTYVTSIFGCNKFERKES